MLEYSLNSAQSLDHVSPIIVQVPQLTIVLLVGPPKWVLFQDLVLFEILSHPPAFVVGECQAVLLEERVDPWYTSVPRVVQVLEGKPAVLRLGLLPLEGILCPDPL